MRRLALVPGLLLVAAAAWGQLRIEVTVPSKTPLHGHLILVISKPSEGQSANGVTTEPRFELREDYKSAQGFGVDADGLAPGNPLVIDEKTVGYPLSNLAALPVGN